MYKMVTRLMKGLGVISSVLLLMLTLDSCSAGQGVGLAATAVQDFRTKYNDEQYQEIYKHSDDSFKKTAPEAEVVDFFSKLREKLGKAGNANHINQSVNVSSMGTMVSMVYDTEFTKGKGQERFVFIIKDGVAKLIDYKVDSPLLITQ